METARKNAVLSEEMVRFLLDDSKTLGARVALINALSWDFNGKQNAAVFEEALLKKYRLKELSEQYDVLEADDLTCLSYLKAMDNYFEVGEAYQIIQTAKKKAPRSYAVQMIAALIESQHHTVGFDWCEVYLTCMIARQDPTVDKDLKEEAVDAIFNYIDIYKGSCSEEELSVLDGPMIPPAFFEAAQHGDIALLHDYLSHGVDLETTDAAGKTVLIHAADGNQVSMVEELLRLGSDVSHQDDEGRTALFSAAEAGKMELVQTLVEAGADFNMTDNYGRTAAMYAAFYGHYDEIKYLFEMGADLTLVENELGYTVYHIAAEAGHESIVNYLLQNKIVSNPNQPLVNGANAAYLAYTNEHEDLAASLIEQGADPVQKTDEGYHLFLMTLVRQDLAFSRFLIGKGADVNGLVGGGGGFRLLTAFATQEDPTVLQFLLKEGADVNLRDSDGGTPFIEAARNGLLDNMDILLRHGANPQAVNDMGRNGLHYAAYEGHAPVIEKLLDLGLKVNLPDAEGTTALMHAASGEQLVAVDALLQHKAKVNLRNDNDNSALIYAAKNENPEILELLLAHGAKINAADHNGTTPLMFTIGKPQCMEVLFQHRKLDMDRANEEGQTALHVAVALDDLATVQELLDAGADLDVKDNKGRGIMAYAQSDAMEVLLQDYFVEGE